MILRKLEELLKQMREEGANDLTRVFVKKQYDSPVGVDDIYLDGEEDLIISWKV